MISLIAAAALALAGTCPQANSFAPTKQEQQETERWLRHWARTGWIGVSPSDQRFRIEVHGPFGDPGYEMRGWRTAKGWRVFSREVFDSYHREPLRQPEWRELNVDPLTSGRIDRVLNDDCLWASPRVVIDPTIGGKLDRPAKPTAVDRVEAGVVTYDLRRGEQEWLGYQAITQGPPAELAVLALSLVVGFI